MKGRGIPLPDGRHPSSLLAGREGFLADGLQAVSKGFGRHLVIAEQGEVLLAVSTNLRRQAPPLVARYVLQAIDDVFPDWIAEADPFDHRDKAANPRRHVLLGFHGGQEFQELDALFHMLGPLAYEETIGRTTITGDGGRGRRRGGKYAIIEGGRGFDSGQGRVDMGGDRGLAL